MAMLQVFDYLQKQKDSHMILQIHDEIILEVPKKNTAKIAAESKRIMEQVYPLRVPLVVDVSTGDNWGEL